VFCREVVSASKASDPDFDAPGGGGRAKLPCLLFLQGGPGFEAARPTEAGGWLAEAAKQFRVFLLDQRGTGRSARVTCESLTEALRTGAEATRSGTVGVTEEEATRRVVAYVASHRADAVVCDAECVRETILGKDSKWSVLGQSFGGFCVTRYLSVSPNGVREALYTGGLPPLIRNASGVAFDAYSRLLRRVRRQNEMYYKRFPGDVGRVLEIAAFLERNEKGAVMTPAGNAFDLRYLQALGFSNLGVAGGFETLHYAFETAWEVGSGRGNSETSETPSRSRESLSYAFLKFADDALRFDTNPLYALAHESIYVNGEGDSTAWAAERALRAFNAAHDDIFDAAKTVSAWRRFETSGGDGGGETRPLYFTGEMVFPFFFDGVQRLKPLRGVAEALARKNDWPRLYCADTLNANGVPVACASYSDDAFVDWDLANETALEIKDARVWTTNEYAHSGIREDGGRIFSKLLELARDEDPAR
jgi:pimeloyl-ACP methyl ester carboxylesterase